jgi:hypothetical protein
MSVGSNGEDVKQLAKLLTESDSFARESCVSV